MFAYFAVEGNAWMYSGQCTVVCTDPEDLGGFQLLSKTDLCVFKKMKGGRIL